MPSLYMIPNQPAIKFTDQRRALLDRENHRPVELLISISSPHPYPSLQPNPSILSTMCSQELPAYLDSAR